MSRSLLVPVALSALLAAPVLAREALPGRAVQNRQRTPTHEFTVAAGLLPLDAFEKGATASVAYTLHFTDVWGWEVLHAVYSAGLTTDLEAELAAFDLQPTPFERLEYFVTSNAVFKPLYWKGAWLDGPLSTGELLLLVGGGYGWLTRTERPAVDAGAAVRVYLGEHVSARLDVRWHGFLNTEDVHNELWIGLGLSVGP